MRLVPADFAAPADGWLAIFYSPEHAGELMGHIEKGRSKAGKTLEDFDVVPTVPVIFGEGSAEGLEACAAPLRHYSALYIGGMGSREQNFYNRLAVSMGYDDAAARVQDLYLARQHRDAAEAVPFEFIDRTSLIGPPERIRDRLHAYAEAGVTTLSLASYAGGLDERVGALRTMAEVLDTSGLGE